MLSNNSLKLSYFKYSLNDKKNIGIILRNSSYSYSYSTWIEKKNLKEILRCFCRIPGEIIVIFEIQISDAIINDFL